MTWLDGFVIFTLSLSMLIGLWRGFIRELFAIGAWVAGVVCAMQFSPITAHGLQNMIKDATLLTIASYVVTFLAAYIVVAIVGAVIRSLMEAVGLSFLDRSLGGMFGLARGALIVLIVCSLIATTPISKSDEWTQAAVAQPLKTALLAFQSFMPDNVNKYLRRTAAHHNTWEFA